MAPRGALIAFCFVQAFRSYRSRGRKRERDVRRNAPRVGVGRAQPREPRPSDGQCRNDLTGRVTTGRHPCSPREVTLGASPPRPWPGGSRGFFITPTASVASSPERLPRDTVKKKKEMLMLLSRFICIFPLRTSRPRRGASLKCGPLSKRAPIAGVLRPLLQVTFCERAANETRVASSSCVIRHLLFTSCYIATNS